MTAPQATRKPKIRENIPAPNTPEGEYFNYTPDEAAQWTPFSARTLRDKVARKEIPHVDNGRDTKFLGRQIVEINESYVVEPFVPPKAVARTRTAA